MVSAVVLAVAIVMPHASGAEPWRCSGTLVPPAGYEQDVAFAPTADAATSKARAAVTSRICQGAACPDLAARVAIWIIGEGGGQHCAMAVLEKHLIDEWRQTQSSRALHAELATKVGEALGAPPSAKVKAKAKVVVGRVGGGGHVERWLRGQLAQGLSSIDGVDLVAAPAKGVAVVDLDVVERQEVQRSILDVTVAVTRADGTMKAAGVTVPRAAVPVVVDDAPKAAELTLQVTATCERKEGGAFVPVRDCAQTPLFAGDRLKLSVAPSSPAHIYVMAYNSLGQFQMLYPAPDQSNLVTGTMQLPDGDWLELDEVKNVTEHLVVVAATARQSYLELMRGVDIAPRKGAQDADALVATRGFLGEVRSRGFKNPAGQAKTSTPPAGAGAAPMVERGPGVAAVELTFAHR